MHIISAGDSFTFGEELEDKNNAWPVLVAKHFNATIDNLAEPGGSNEKILRKVINYIVSFPEKTDLVLIGWTSPGRKEYADESGAFDLWPGYAGDFSNTRSPWRNQLIKYVDIHHDVDHLYQIYLQQILLLQAFLDTRGIRYAMAEVCPGDHYIMHNNFDDLHYDKNINKDAFIEYRSSGIWNWGMGFEQGPRNHFLDSGHRYVASKFIDKINLMKIV